jgi:hypothetical protein
MANVDRIVTDRRITKQGIGEFLTRARDPIDRLLDEFGVLDTSGTSGEDLSYNASQPIGRPRP